MQLRSDYKSLWQGVELLLGIVKNYQTRKSMVNGEIVRTMGIKINPNADGKS